MANLPTLLALFVSQVCHAQSVGPFDGDVGLKEGWETAAAASACVDFMSTGQACSPAGVTQVADSYFFFTCTAVPRTGAGLAHSTAVAQMNLHPPTAVHAIGTYVTTPSDNGGFARLTAYDSQGDQIDVVSVDFTGCGEYVWIGVESATPISSVNLVSDASAIAVDDAAAAACPLNDRDCDGILLPDDCDDFDGLVGGLEVCDGLDNDCNGSIDDTSDADSDVDGVSDECDRCPGGDDAVDTDADGICDALDTCPGGPDDADADGDGVCDLLDPCPQQANDTDTDGDGICDSVDPCPSIPNGVDQDGDGVCGGEDCDDTDPNRSASCDAVPDEPPGGCSATPARPADWGSTWLRLFTRR